MFSGIDEAGRGPVIGPMVIALTSFTKTAQNELARIGVKDSKQLSPKKRVQILPSILRLAKKIFVAIIPPPTIDSWVKQKKLNLLEAKTIALLIQKANPQGFIYVDAPSNSSTFLKHLLSYLPKHYHGRIVTESKADKKYVVVSAASIVAKVIRDLRIQSLQKKLRINFGSGYPSDPLTRQALDILIRTAPEHVRKTWLTIKKITNRSLLEYL